MSEKPKGRTADFDATFIRDVSEAIYRQRLEDSCKGAVDRMLAEDNDGGHKLRNRASSYDVLSRAYARYFRDLTLSRPDGAWRSPLSDNPT